MFETPNSATTGDAVSDVAPLELIIQPTNPVLHGASGGFHYFHVDCLRSSHRTHLFKLGVMRKKRSLRIRMIFQTDSLLTVMYKSPAEVQFLQAPYIYGAGDALSSV